MKPATAATIGVMANARLSKALRAAENTFSPLLLVLITLILLITIVARLLGVSTLRASNDYIRYLVLWITFAGAMITTRERSHLSLSIGVERMPAALRRWVVSGTSLVAAAVCTVLALSSFSFIITGFDPGARVGFIPIRVATIIMPLGFLFMMVRFILTPEREAGRRLIALIGVPVGLVIGSPPLVSALLTLLPLGGPFRCLARHCGDGLLRRRLPRARGPAPAPHHRADRKRLPGRPHLRPGGRAFRAVLPSLGGRPGDRGQPGIHHDHR